MSSVYNNIPQSWNEAVELMLESSGFKKLGYHTELVVDSFDTISLRYFGTTIVRYFNNDTIEANPHGYHTTTTMRRVNSAIGKRAHIWRHKWVWYIQAVPFSEDRPEQLFVDGMLIDPDGTIA